MLIKKGQNIPSSEITPQRLYVNRRKFLAGAAAGAAAVAAVGFRELASPAEVAHANTRIEGLQKSSFSTSESVTPFKDVSNYNNYYEFSTDKYEPAGLAKNFKTRPWTVTIEGHVAKPKTLDIDSLMKLVALEDRVYRLRCVEGWSMVIPWVGYPLSKLIEQVQPTSKA